MVMGRSKKGIQIRTRDKYMRSERGCFQGEMAIVSISVEIPNM